MFTEIKTGLSNKIFVSYELGILIRIFGDQANKLVDRTRESAILNLLKISNIGPSLIFEHQAGRVEQYLNAVPPSKLDYRSYAKQVVTNMKTMHNFKAPNNIIQPSCLDCIYKWTIIAKELDKTKEFAELFACQDNLVNLIQDQATSNLVLCHNDLHCDNMLLDKSNKLYFIDFEYADYNYPEYDIANHFNELCLTCTETSFIFEEPRQEQENLFLDLYYKNQEIPEILEFFKVVSEYVWTLWGICMSTSQNKFPYLDYARTRQRRFFDGAEKLKLLELA